MLEGRALMRGVPQKVGEAITATGTGNIRPFSILKVPGPSTPVRCMHDGTVTAFAGNLEYSLDGGVTWRVFIAFDFFATPNFTFNADAGVLYRFNVTGITQSVVPNIWAVLS